MNYLWIILVILAVLSPLMWFKPSRHQLKITTLRRRAAELGLRVQLVPAADAREDEKRPTAVRYLLPLEKKGGHWTLVRGESESWRSPWSGWRWSGEEAPEELRSVLQNVLPTVPENIDAIKRDNQGLSVYWDERGDITVVDNILKIIKSINT